MSALPPGQLSEIVGPRSSGATSLLLALLVRTTAAGGLAALVDAEDSFDPAGAATAGADLNALLWVRCRGQATNALTAADLLARCPGFAVVALDLGEPAVERRSLAPAAWLRLQRAVRGSETVLVVRAPRHLAGSTAALVLGARKRRAHWIGSPRCTRLAGLVSEVQVLRSRAGASSGNPRGWGNAWAIPGPPAPREVWPGTGATWAPQMVNGPAPGTLRWSITWTP